LKLEASEATVGNRIPLDRASVISMHAWPLILTVDHGGTPYTLDSSVLSDSHQCTLYRWKTFPKREERDNVVAQEITGFPCTATLGTQSVLLVLKSLKFDRCFVLSVINGSTKQTTDSNCDRSAREGGKGLPWPSMRFLS
jgi:hypothetical protein